MTSGEIVLGWTCAVLAAYAIVTEFFLRRLAREQWQLIVEQKRLIDLAEINKQCTRHPASRHGRLLFGTPIKREETPVVIEPDEKVEVLLPTIVDDDGDPVEVDRVDWSVDDAGTAFVEPIGDGKASAWLTTTGRTGQVHVKANVYGVDGGFGAYEGDVVVGLAPPVGGTLGFGTPVKRDAAPPVEG